MSFLKNLFSSTSEYAEDNIRIIITRHGERADLVLGPDWMQKMKKNPSIKSLISYLPPRSNFGDWSYDSPLTTNGERQSMATGRKLLQLGYSIDYCYSSPAYRSIQTANKILDSQGRRDVSINIEPGLFECPSWYKSAPLTFIPPEELAVDRHFNINSSYSPIFSSVDPGEDERRYYHRSKQLIDSIIKAHKYEGGTILLSGHAGSIEAITRGMLGRRARPERLHSEAGKVNFCNFAVLERDFRTRQWVVHSPSYYNENHGSSHRIRSTIPLHSATSQYFQTNNLPDSSFSSKKYLYGNKSFNYFQY